MMNETSLELLQSKLRARMRGISEIDDLHLRYALRRLWNFVQSNPVCRDVLAQLQMNPDGHNFGAHFFNGQLRQVMSTGALANDTDYAAAAYWAWRRLHEGDYDELNQVNIGFYGQPATGILTDRCIRFKKQFLFPILEYVLEQIDERELMFHHLLRYKDSCECFRRAELCETIAQFQAAGERRVEKLLQSDFYRYLHDQGVDFVVEPHLQRGEIDVIASIKGPDPKYIETKVFRDDSQGVSEIADGFGQLFSYVNNYNATAGYLAIFNLSPQFVGLSLDEAVRPSLHILRHSGAIFYFLVVDLYIHDKSPSERGRVKETPITKERLIKTAPGISALRP